MARRRAGDIHGDKPAAMEILRRAGLVDLRGQWVGGPDILVQTGGVLRDPPSWQERGENAS